MGMSLLEVLGNSVTSNIVLEKIDPMELTLPNKCISKSEVNYLLENRKQLSEAAIDPVAKQLLTIYHGTSSESLKGKIVWILHNLAS